MVRCRNGASHDNGNMTAIRSGAITKQPASLLKEGDLQLTLFTPDDKPRHGAYLSQASKWLQDHQDDDTDHQQHRHLMHDAVKTGRARLPISSQASPFGAEKTMETGEQNHKK